MYQDIENLPKNKRVINSNLSYIEFFVCCMLLGLEFIHTNNILHRDIKPENLVLDDRGK